MKENEIDELIKNNLERINLLETKLKKFEEIEKEIVKDSKITFSEIVRKIKKYENLKNNFSNNKTFEEILFYLDKFYCVESFTSQNLGKENISYLSQIVN